MTGSPVKRKCPANSTFEKIETSVSKKRRVADEAKAHDGVKGIRQAPKIIIAATSNKTMKPSSTSCKRKTADEAIKNTMTVNKKRKTDGTEAGIGGKSAGLVPKILVSIKTKASTPASTKTKGVIESADKIPSTGTGQTAKMKASRVLRVRVRDDLYVERDKNKDRKNEAKKSRK